MSQSTFHLKGTGWYVTDYANKTNSSSASSMKKDKKSDTESASSKKKEGSKDLV
jgi:hypothetical protein